MSGGQRTAALLQAVDTMPAWARTTVYWAGGVLFAAGLSMSGFFLTLLAVAFRIDLPFGLLLPAALDAGAIVGVVMWVTGTGQIESFGRGLARLLFGLSILGNGLERVLTFAAIPPQLARADVFAQLVGRTNALFVMLTKGSAGEIAVTWFLLVCSVGLGVVFPLLAYKMAHGIILARKAADSPAPRHKRSVPAVEVTPERPGLMARATAALAARVIPGTGEAGEQLPAQQPAPAAAAAVVPQQQPAAPKAYEHDPRDLEPGTPEWAERFASLPGSNKAEKAQAWVLAEWDAGREPTGAAVDKVIDGKSTGRAAMKRLREDGHQPPSERPTPKPELVRADANPSANGSQPGSQADAKEWGDRERAGVA